MKLVLKYSDTSAYTLTLIVPSWDREVIGNEFIQYLMFYIDAYANLSNVNMNMQCPPEQAFRPTWHQFRGQ